MTTHAPDLDELEALAKAATPGPWQIGRLGDQKMSHVVDFGPHPKSPYMVLLDGTPAQPTMGFTGFSPSGVAHADNGSSEANAAFIAAANPTTLLALIARVKAAEGALAEVQLQCLSEDDMADECLERVFGIVCAVLPKDDTQDESAPPHPTGAPDMTTPTIDEKALEAAVAATILGEDVDGNPMHILPNEARTAILSYLSALGAEPVAKGREGDGDHAIAPTPTISDEAVERACEAYYVDWQSMWPESQAIARKSMRAALAKEVK